MELLQYEFMRRALLAGLLVGTLCPTIGLFLVLRRLSMVGDTLAHVSLCGVLVGVLANANPLPVAVGMSVIFSLFLEKLRSFFRYYGELSLAVLMSTGLGIAVILLGITRFGDGGISSLLFGSIITISRQDLLITALLSASSYLLVLFFYREFFLITFDEESARLSGIKVEILNHLLIILASLVIASGMRIVGALLVSSLMVIPAATGLILRKGFLSTLLWANFFGLVSVLLGLIVSFYLDLAPGGTIVTFSVLIFLLLLSFNFRTRVTP